VTVVRRVVPPEEKGPSLPIAFGPVRSRRFGWSLGVNKRAPALETAQHAAEVFRSFGVPVSSLFEEIAEGDGPFRAPGDPASGLLGIVAVHPRTESAARDFIARAGGDWSAVRALIERGRLARVRHAGRTYLRASPPLRRPSRPSGPGREPCNR
jgi:hypothetical protein